LNWDPLASIYGVVWVPLLTMTVRVCEWVCLFASRPVIVAVNVPWFRVQAVVPNSPRPSTSAARSESVVERRIRRRARAIPSKPTTHQDNSSGQGVPNACGATAAVVDVSVRVRIDTALEAGNVTLAGLNEQVMLDGNPVQLS
jgi:hypothetical protein